MKVKANRGHEPGPLPKPRKILIGAVCLILLFVVGMQGCALTKFGQAEPKDEVLSIVIGDENITIRLPSELSKDKLAELEYDKCWNVKLCVQGYSYNEDDEPGFEFLNFWYTCQNGKSEIFAVVWAKRDNISILEDMGGWLYDEKGFPILSTEQDINEIIEKLYYSKMHEEEDKPTQSI